MDKFQPFEQMKVAIDIDKSLTVLFTWINVAKLWLPVWGLKVENTNLSHIHFNV